MRKRLMSYFVKHLRWWTLIGLPCELHIWSSMYPLYLSFFVFSLQMHESHDKKFSFSYNGHFGKFSWTNENLWILNKHAHALVLHFQNSLVFTGYLKFLRPQTTLFLNYRSQTYRYNWTWVFPHNRSIY